MVLPKGIGYQENEKSAGSQKEEHECENPLDDRKIEDALIPTADLNTESDGTNSENEEAEIEQDSQSIDLSVSPIKNKENLLAEESHTIIEENKNQNEKVKNESENKAQNEQVIPKTITPIGVDKNPIKPGDVEQTLRQLLDLPDA